MAAKNKVTVSSTEQFNRRLTHAERREARTAALANQQATLKQEAAERRLNRAAVAPKEPRRGRQTTR